MKDVLCFTEVTNFTFISMLTVGGCAFRGNALGTKHRSGRASAEREAGSTSLFLRCAVGGRYGQNVLPVISGCSSYIHVHKEDGHK